MNNEETVQKIIDIIGTHNLYQADFIVSDITTDILSIFGEESNDIVVGVLEELNYISELITEENFVEIGNRLECLRDNLINGDIPKIITNKNVVLGKVFEGLKEPSSRFELDMIIRETLAK